MAQRDEIVKHLLDTGLIEECVKYQTIRSNDVYLKEELTQECWLWVLGYDLEKLSDAYENGHLNALVTRYLQNQWFSDHSDFHNRYRKRQKLEDEITLEALQIPVPPEG